MGKRDTLWALALTMCGCVTSSEDAYKGSAWSAYLNNDYAKAVQLYQPMVDKGIKSCESGNGKACAGLPDLLNNLGRAKLKLGEIEGAKADFKKAVFVAGNTINYHSALAYSVAIEGLAEAGDSEAARKVYADALSKGYSASELASGLAKVDPEVADRSFVNLVLRQPSAADSLRLAISKAQRYGWAKEVQRLNVLLAAVNTIESGRPVTSSDGSAAIYAALATKYRAAGATEYASWYASVADRARDDVEAKESFEKENAEANAAIIASAVSSVGRVVASRSGGAASASRANAARSNASTVGSDCRLIPLENFPRGNYDAGISLARSNCACMGGQLSEQRATLSASCVTPNGSNGYQMGADGGWNGATR